MSHRALIKLIAAAAATVLVSFAQAVPVTYTFTGYTSDDDHLSVDGALTFDLDGLTTTTTTIGVVGMSSGATALSSYATFSVDNGPVSTIVAGQAGQTLAQLVRSDGFNAFVLTTQAGSATDASAVQSYLGLTTTDARNAADSLIYQTPVIDLNLGQGATFTTPGSFNVGSLFSASTGGRDFVITSAQWSTQVAAVPEPSGIELTLAGLVTVLAIRRRRQPS